jgi:hypothetical protein
VEAAVQEQSRIGICGIHIEGPQQRLAGNTINAPFYYIAAHIITPIQNKKFKQKDPADNLLQEWNFIRQGL